MKGRTILFGTLLFLLLGATGCGRAVAPPTLAAGEAAPAQRVGFAAPSGAFTEGLVVVGTGTASAEPEIARVAFGVEVQGRDAAAVVDEAARKINAALAAAREVGVAEEDLHTTGYNLWVETIYDPEQRRPTGEVVYHLSHTVQATVRDLSRLGDLLAAVVEAGANVVSDVTFSAEDPAALVAEARRAALKDAQARAEQMAQVLEIGLGKPVLVQEIGGNVPAPMPERVMAVEAAPGVTPPEISPGAFTVSVSVQVVYEIP